MYGGRRGPKLEIEKIWPRKQRSMYCRLRTDHCKQLQNFQANKIRKADSALCPKCEDEDEDIRHIICLCPTLEEKRGQIQTGEWRVRDMIDNPLECMELLQHRFPELVIPAATDQ